MEKDRNNSDEVGALGVFGGFALIGAVGTALTAVTGEAVEFVLPAIDSFPSGTLAKVSGTLACIAVGCISADINNRS